MASPSTPGRSFGIVFAVFFLVVGLWPLGWGSPARAWALAAAGAFLVAGLAAPRLLAPLERLWLRFGDLLHRVVSPVALGVLFYLVVTPTGFAMRLFGKDPLRLRRDPDAPTYWIDRSPPGPSADSLKDPF